MQKCYVGRDFHQNLCDFEAKSSYGWIGKQQRCPQWHTQDNREYRRFYLSFKRLRNCARMRAQFELFSLILSEFQ